MIERGSGRTRGITDWQLMDVHSMWACLQDQDTTGQWKQVAGWRKICDLALAHLGRLREYRRGLAEAWPPETNAAARAYLGELDQLIDKVQRTHDTAAANYDALAAATRAIGSTRAELKPLHNEYVTKLKQKQAYEEIAADPKAVAGSRLPATSPVTDADLERLNVRARGLMSGLSGELQQAQAMLSKPPLPVRPGRQANDPDAYDVTTAIPVISPVIPVPVTSSESVPLTKRAAAASQQVSAPRNVANSGAGPVLGGASPGLAPAPPQLTSPGTTPASFSSGAGLPSFLPPTAGFGKAPATPYNRSPVPPGQALNESANTNLHATPPGGTRAMPPGGLIGGVPGSGLGQGQPTGATTPRRINPVGGVIGRGGAGTAPSGAAGSRPGGSRAAHLNAFPGFSPIGGSPSTASTGSSSGWSHLRQQETGEPRTWDPDNPWETDQGVPPIMIPPDDDDPVDPGPAIGLNR